jgi:hypothetical protein
MLVSVGYLLLGPMSLVFYLMADSLVFVKKSRELADFESGAWLISIFSFLILFVIVLFEQQNTQWGLFLGFTFVWLRAIAWPFPQIGLRTGSDPLESSYWLSVYWISAVALMSYQPNMGQLVIIATLLLFLQLRPTAYSLSLLAFLMMFGSTTAPLFVLLAFGFISMTSRWVSFVLMALFLFLLRPFLHWSGEVSITASIILFVLLGRAWVAGKHAQHHFWVQASLVVGSLLSLGSLLLIDSKILESILAKEHYEAGMILLSYVVGGVGAAIWQHFWPSALPNFEAWDSSKFICDFTTKEWINIQRRYPGEVVIPRYSNMDRWYIGALYEPVIFTLFLGGILWVALWLY